ncbi:MAG: glycogen/starch/alpha-glucan phosphorylase [Comamonadaceae bacterium]|nr:glycogen/starch/alpha-glucan phosphorylase [Comamonadaceae bacterium]
MPTGHLRFAQGTPVLPTAGSGWLRALAAVRRGELASRWSETQREDFARGARRINYLSMEFLMEPGAGRKRARRARTWCSAAQEGVGGERALADLFEHESDAALGNGGLGRLAACFLDSMATLGVPAFGYGMRYQFGMFRQAIRDGRQVEQPDAWLQAGDHWFISRPDVRYPVGFGGRVEDLPEARRLARRGGRGRRLRLHRARARRRGRRSRCGCWLPARGQVESLDAAAFIARRASRHAAAPPGAAPVAGRLGAVSRVDSTLAGRVLQARAGVPRWSAARAAGHRRAASAGRGIPRRLIAGRPRSAAEAGRPCRSAPRCRRSMRADHWSPSTAARRRALAWAQRERIFS